MDKETLIFNINKACSSAGVKPTVACVDAGVGKDMIGNLRKGILPSVAKVADLAAYLGVSSSDLIGDAAVPAELAPLDAAWAELNEEGRERLVVYAEDLVSSGRYKKHSVSEMEA
jgi:hypothetical protein